MRLAEIKQQVVAIRFLLGSKSHIAETIQCPVDTLEGS